VLVNRETEAQFSYRRDELLGKPVEILVPERFRSQHPGHREDFFADPQARRMSEGRELFGVRKDGSEFPVEIGLRPMETDEGMLVLSAIVDITERKRSHEKLERLEQRFRATVESAPTAMVMIDRQGQIVLVNEETEKQFGYHREELVEQPVEILVPERFRSRHPDYRKGFFADPQARRMGEGRDLFGLRKDGSEFPVEIGLRPMETDEGMFVLSAIVDITERKRSEEQMRRANEALEKSNVELQQFAYIASHDLQEPLRKISSYCQLLKEEQGERLDEEGREYLDVAIDGAERLKTLVRDLLTLSRITTRGKPLAATDADDCLEAALENLELAIEENGAQLTCDPLPVVMADGSQLTLLFQNLVSNALKYRAESVPVIHIGGRDLGGVYEFFVRDNGIGIDPQFNQRIFKIFQRLHNRRDYSGTGIGLALCQRTVERFGGRIWVESEPGAGSTFFFTMHKAIPSGGDNAQVREYVSVGAPD